jgi:hypothetical protein
VMRARAMKTTPMTRVMPRVTASAMAVLLRWITIQVTLEMRISCQEETIRMIAAGERPIVP